MESSKTLAHIANIFCNAVSASRNRMVSEAMKKSGLTNSVAQSLMFIYEHSCCSVGDLARGLNISHPAAVRLASRLTEKGLAEKCECSADKRVSELSLTSDGKKTAEAIKATRAMPLAEAVRTMSVSDRENLERGLEKMVSIMVKDADLIKRICLRCGKRHFETCLINRKYLALTGRHIEGT